jgi:plastocyanin
MTTLVLDRRQLLFTGGVALLAMRVPARAHDGTVHVTIDGLAFQPAEIDVRAGQTIEWINKDPFAHTATVRGGWEVMIPPGEVATRVAQAGDTVDYYCRFHPNMKARITIIG